MATKPASGLYPSLKTYGKQGSVKDMKAVGSRWTKAVAINTPVPKCWLKKMMFRCSLLPFMARREKRGNPQAVVPSSSQHQCTIS